MLRFNKYYLVAFIVGWLTLTPVIAFADEITITLTPEIAYVDTVVQVETTTEYTITTTTGPRTEVVDSVVRERVDWVDSWLALYRGVAIHGGTVIAQDDDSNHNTQNNYYASRLSGTLTPDTYTIRATSYDFIVANQRPIGTYTLTSNLIPPPVVTAAITPAEPVVEPSPQPTVEPSPEPTPSPTPSPSPTPEPQPEPQPTQNTIYVPPIEVSTPPEQSPAVEPIAELPPVIEPEFIQPPMEEPPAIAPEPPIEQELPPIVEPEPTPIPEDAPPIAELPPLTVEQFISLVEDLVADGNLSTADATGILRALMVDGEITSTEVNNLSEQLSQDGTFTKSERQLVAEALIESAEGQAVTVEAIAEAGITLADLPPSTPVEVRQDANGNQVIVIAEVAAALVILESPVELLSTIFSDPAQALLAISSIGADMSDEERSESEQTIVAAVIVTGIAVQSATSAALVGSASYRRRL